MRERRLIKVSVLVDYLKKKLDGDPILRGVLLEGEVSNMRMPTSGHLYFSLKDTEASITCVMFKYQAASLTFRPENGMNVIVTADVTLYEKEGRTQLRILTMKPAGIGDLYIKLEEIKKKLANEGLFNQEHKKLLPKYPMSFGLITGNDTAARKDIYRTFYERWPLATIQEYPTPVQGEAAIPRIIASLKKADEDGHDVILLVRGGGSLEDLWCFNDEGLCRVIYDMNTPIVTGVGHETDTTLVDYVADVRANTPTGAVEIATPDVQSVINDITHKKMRMLQVTRNYYAHQKQNYTSLSSRPIFKDPMRLIEEKTMHLDSLEQKLMHTQSTITLQKNHLLQVVNRMNEAMQQEINLYRQILQQDSLKMESSIQKKIYASNTNIISYTKSLQQNTKSSLETNKKELAHKITMLNSYNPLNVIARGYSVIKKDNAVIKSIEDIKKNDIVTMELKDGIAISEIKEVKGK